ncbi:MAG: hypothetical protein WDW36_002190 [Sanguina aurantia]
MRQQPPTPTAIPPLTTRPLGHTGGYGDEYQLLTHTLQRWQHFVVLQLARRADRVAENAADASRRCRVLVSAFAAMRVRDCDVGGGGGW